MNTSIIAHCMVSQFGTCTHSLLSSILLTSELLPFLTVYTGIIMCQQYIDRYPGHFSEQHCFSQQYLVSKKAVFLVTIPMIKFSADFSFNMERDVEK